MEDLPLGAQCKRHCPRLRWVFRTFTLDSVDKILYTSPICNYPKGLQISQIWKFAHRTRPLALLSIPEISGAQSRVRHILVSTYCHRWKNSCWLCAGWGPNPLSSEAMERVPLPSMSVVSGFYPAPIIPHCGASSPPPKVDNGVSLKLLADFRHGAAVLQNVFLCFLFNVPAQCAPRQPWGSSDYFFHGIHLCVPGNHDCLSKHNQGKG